MEEPGVARTREARTTTRLKTMRAVQAAVAECRRAVHASQRSVAICSGVVEGRQARWADAAGRPDRARDQAVERVARLRPRELEVLVLYSLGLRTEEVASALFVSRHTIRTHVKNALARLEVHSRPEALALLHDAAGSADVSLAAMRILPELQRWGNDSPALAASLEALATGQAA